MSILNWIVIATSIYKYVFVQALIITSFFIATQKLHYDFKETNTYWFLTLLSMGLSGAP